MHLQKSELSGNAAVRGGGDITRSDPCLLSLSSLRATARCGHIDLVGSLVDLLDVDDLFDRTMIAKLTLPETLLMIEFLSERFVDLAVAFVISVVPQSGVTMTIVAPTGVINDWIKTNAFELNTGRCSRARFLPDVAQP